MEEDTKPVVEAQMESIKSCENCAEYDKDFICGASTSCLMHHTYNFWKPLPAPQKDRAIKKQGVICPFCMKDDFDLIGLRNHLNYCVNYHNTETL